MAKEAHEFPKTFEIQQDLRARVGYADSHVVIGYDVGFPVGWYDLRVEPAEIDIVERVAVAARKWREALRSGAAKAENRLQAFTISKRVVAYVGYADGRVEIHVDITVKTIRIRIAADRIERVEEIVKEAKAWRERPEIERYLAGAE